MLQKYLAIVAESQVFTNGIIYDYSGKAQAEIQICISCSAMSSSRALLKICFPFSLTKLKHA